VAVRWLASLERAGVCGLLADEAASDRRAEIAGLMALLAASPPPHRPEQQQQQPATAATPHGRHSLAAQASVTSPPGPSALQPSYSGAGGGGPRTAGGGGGGVLCSVGRSPLPPPPSAPRPPGAGPGMCVCVLLAPSCSLAGWREAVVRLADGALLGLHTHDGSPGSEAALRAAGAAARGEAGAGGPLRLNGGHTGATAGHSPGGAVAGSTAGGWGGWELGEGGREGVCAWREGWRGRGLGAGRAEHRHELLPPLGPPAGFCEGSQGSGSPGGARGGGDPSRRRSAMGGASPAPAPPPHSPHPSSSGGPPSCGQGQGGGPLRAPPRLLLVLSPLELLSRDAELLCGLPLRLAVLDLAPPPPPPLMSPNRGGLRGAGGLGSPGGQAVSGVGLGRGWQGGPSPGGRGGGRRGLDAAALSDAALLQRLPAPTRVLLSGGWAVRGWAVRCTCCCSCPQRPPSLPH
jgi:hypothetical protein